MKSHRVVITGVGVLSVVGDAREIASAVCQQRHNGRTRRDAERPSKESGVYVESADIERTRCPLLKNKTLRRRSDRFSHMAMAAAWSAVCQGAAAENRVFLEQTGVFVGSQFGGRRTTDEQFRVLRAKGPQRVSAFLVPTMMGNAAAGNIAVSMDIRGPSLGLAGANAGADAVLTAYPLIASQTLQAALVGAAEAPLTVDLMAQPDFSPLHRVRRPAEGAGILLIESEKSAQERNASVLAIITGVGTGRLFLHSVPENDRPDRPMVIRNHHALDDAIRQAVLGAGLTLDDISIICRADSGNPEVDDVITQVVSQLFRSTLTNPSACLNLARWTGFPFAAAGAIQLAVCAEVLQSGTLPSQNDSAVQTGAFKRDDSRLSASQRRALNRSNIRHILVITSGVTGEFSVFVLSRT